MNMQKYMGAHQLNNLLYARLQYTGGNSGVMEFYDGNCLDKALLKVLIYKYTFNHTATHRVVADRHDKIEMNICNMHTFNIIYTPNNSNVCDCK